MDARIEQQLGFLIEADKLKSVIRGTTLNDNSRHENSGEHSWHIALYALVMAEHAAKSVNVDRVIKMLLLHDLVEIDARAASEWIGTSPASFRRGARPSRSRRR